MSATVTAAPSAHTARDLGREILAAFAAVPGRIEAGRRADGTWMVEAATVEDALAHVRRVTGQAWVMSTLQRRTLTGTRVRVVVSEHEPPALPEAPAATVAALSAWDEHAATSQAPDAPADEQDRDAQAVEPVTRTEPDDQFAPIDLLLDGDDYAFEPAPLPSRSYARPAAPAPAPASAPAARQRSTSFAGALSRHLEEDLRSLDDNAIVPPPVLPPTRPKRPTFPGSDTLTGLGVTGDALRVLARAPGRTWQERVKAAMAAAPAPACDDAGGAAVVGYGPKGAAVVLSAMLDGLEVGGLRAERGARIGPVTPRRVVALLEQGAGNP